MPRRRSPRGSGNNLSKGMSERPTPPSEFELPLSGTAVWAGPDGLGDSSFDDVPAPQAVELPPELGDDPRIALRRTLGMFATGVTVLTTREADQVHGMTANAFMSVSLEPPLVLISVDRRTKMCSLLHERCLFGVSVLAADQRALSDRFAGRAGDDAPEPRFVIVREAPVVKGSAAQFVSRVVRSYWGGDHSLFLGQVEYARRAPDARPLLFHGGQYGRLVDEA